MQHSVHRPAFLVPVISLALAAASASATDGRYRDFVIGDRAGGMGGAAIATASDVDAIFYNPAGLSLSAPSKADQDRCLRQFVDAGLTVTIGG